MDWPILSAWSDPAVADIGLLTKLAAVNDNVAVGVCANPNVPQDVALAILGRVQLTVDRAIVVARLVLPRLDTDGQTTVVRLAAARSPRVIQVILAGCSDDTLAAVSDAIDARTIRRPNAVRSELSDLALERATDPTHTTTASLAKVVAQVVPDANSGYPLWEDAVVSCFQTRDFARMTQLLAAHRPTRHVIDVSAILGVPGAADAWFAMGGKFRTAAVADTTITVEPVLNWLTSADPLQESEAIVAAVGNVAIPVTALTSAMVRLSAMRWPGSGTAPAKPLVQSVTAIGDALDARLEHVNWSLTKPVATEDDPAVLERLLTAVTAGVGRTAVQFELLANEHLDDEQHTTLLGATDRSLRLLAPPARERIRDGLRNLELRSPEAAAEVARSLRFLTHVPAERTPPPTAGQARAALEATWARNKARQHAPLMFSLREVGECSDGVVHLYAPRMAAELPDVQSWVSFYEMAETHKGRFEAVLGKVLVEHRENQRPRALAALLGDALGDMDD